MDKFFSTINKFNQGWNISLFHYRNHGHDFGRVLVGMIIKESEAYAYQEFLDKLGYTFYDETTNPAYLHFLR